MRGRDPSGRFSFSKKLTIMNRCMNDPQDFEQDTWHREDITAIGSFDRLTNELIGLKDPDVNEAWLKKNLPMLFAASSRLHLQLLDTSVIRGIHDFLPPFSGCVGSVMTKQNEMVNGDAMGTIANLITVLESDTDL